MNPTASFEDGEREVVAVQLRRLGVAAASGTLGGLLAAAAIGSLVGGTDAAAVEPKLVLYPAFPMFFLVAIVLTVMGWKRIGGVLRGVMPIGYYRTFDKGEEPESHRVVTRNFLNLFEMPLLFHVGVILAFVSGEVTGLAVGLAWSYVGLRYAHSFVHLTSNDVALRLACYGSSGIVLLVFWATLFARMLDG